VEQEVEETQADMSRKAGSLQDHVKWLSAIKESALAKAAKVEKQQMTSGKLYCTIMNVDTMKDMMRVFQKEDGERKLQKRDDLAQALQACNYLGGGEPKQMVKYILKAAASFSQGDFDCQPARDQGAAGHHPSL
jgi:hypothetical protein